jgi:hypothetical protein
MASVQSPFISIALSRLRRGVGGCCLLIAISLITQILVFGVAAFMDVRHETIEAPAAPATIVSAEAAARTQPLGSIDARPLESPAAAKVDSEPVNPNIMRTRQDTIMQKASAIAMTAGKIAMIMLLPMLMVGVMLSAASATPGVEKVVSSFMWSLMVGLLVLPMGGMLGLPWEYGGLVPYEHMTQHVDVQMVEGQWGSMTFHARFALLPLACLAGIGLVGLRFSNGVVAGIIPKEDLRIDPTLEREAGNIKVSSLHGGRSAAALRTVAPPPVVAPHVPAVTAVTANGASEVKPGMLQAVAGEAPKRLI